LGAVPPWPPPAPPPMSADSCANDYVELSVNLFRRLYTLALVVKRSLGPLATA